MKKKLLLASIMTACLVLLAVASEDKSPKPRYDEKGRLMRPADYR
jgi:hypothetical protein